MTTLLSLVLQPWAQTLGWTLIHFLWQGAVLGLLAWGSLLLLRGVSAKARYGVACAFLLLMVAAPVLTFLVLRPQATTPAAITPLARAAAAAATEAPLALRVKATLDPSLPWLLAGWAAGVLLLSARFLGSWIRVQRLRRRSATPVPSEWHLVLSRLCRELKLSRTVRLLQSAAVEVPTALGWLRPVILLPACALTGLAPLQLEAILAHELAHIRRGDFLVNLLQSLVEVLLFYHPAVWWLSSRIRAERELCCDDVAAALCGDPLLLARALTDLEALREPLQPSPTRLAMAANGGSLMHRIRHLLHPALPVTIGARATALTLLAASLLGAAGVALQDKTPAAKADRNTHIKVVDDDRQVDLQMKGDVKLNGEAPEPVVVAGDGSFRVEEKKAGKTRTYSATRAKASYQVDGQEHPLDQEGKDWLRGMANQVQKANRERAHAQVIKIRTGDHAAHDKAMDAHDLDLEIHTQDMEAHAKDMELHAKELEAQARELEAHGQSMSAEERAQVQADLDQARADLARAKAELKKEMRVEVIRAKGGQSETVTVHGDGDRAGQPRIEKRIEVRTESDGPGTVVIRKKVDGKDVVEKRMKVLRKGGDPKEGGTWAFVGPDGDDEFDQDIHIPPIHIPEINLKHRAPRGLGDPQEEIRELQAAMKSLQSRLDQLQKQVSAAPRAPRTPKPSAAPKAAVPPVPALDAPPPPPPPAAPPAPPAPPAPHAQGA